MHKIENQRELIERTLDIIEKFSGKRPRGWFGPGLTQTFDTLDILRACGIEYIGDWACDDEPVTLKTKSKSIVALPYNGRQHDAYIARRRHRAVDLGRCSPTPPGIFVLHDGMGLVAKRLEYIPNSDPPRVRIISDNPLYKPYEGSGDEINVNGRIRWFAREM